MNDEHEPLLLDRRPSSAFTLLRRLGWIITLSVVGLLGLIVHLSQWPTDAGLWIAIICLILALVLLLYTCIEREAERYTLSSRAAAWDSGIFRRLHVEAPLQKVQHAVLYRSIRERLFGLGTIGISTAGSGSVEIVWRMIDNPDHALATLREAMNSATARTPPTDPPTQPKVIGLAGGIGAGKSTVAKVLASLGCLVIDSDQRAKAALDRPDVRNQLVSWWGNTILTPDGRVDRTRIASIIFNDPAERERLESLVHPIVRQDRAAMIAESRDHRAVVIDAPLLFEADIAKECDAIIFVDTPFEERLKRVEESRGWDEAELRRREAAQMPVDQKRTSSTYVVDNSANADLEKQVNEVLSMILRC